MIYPSVNYNNQGVERSSSRSSQSTKNWPCSKKRERSFWCKDEKSWDFNKRYQWVKIEKGHARKVTRNFEKWFRESHVESCWRFNHAYAIEAKSIMDERKRKVVEIEKMTDTISSLEKKRKEFWFWLLIFFEPVNCFYIFSCSYRIVLR